MARCSCSRGSGLHHHQVSRVCGQRNADQVQAPFSRHGDAHGCCSLHPAGRRMQRAGACRIYAINNSRRSRTGGTGSAREYFGRRPALTLPLSSSSLALWHATHGLCLRAGAEEFRAQAARQATPMVKSSLSIDLHSKCASVLISQSFSLGQLHSSAYLPHRGAPHYLQGHGGSRSRGAASGRICSLRTCSV